MLNQLDRNSKTLTVANQTEVPILHYANIILNTTIDENSRYFSVLFAVADIKYNILGTPFFEDNIQNINIQDFTLEYKYQSKTHPNYANFTTLLSKDYPYFSYIYRINSKFQIRLKPKSSKIAHFPIKKYHNLQFTTIPQNHFFPSVNHTYFATKFCTNFNFIEVFTDDKPDVCATIIENTSKHVATLPTGHIGYIEVPITNEKPKFFQVNDINTLIHNVTLLNDTYKHDWHAFIQAFKKQFSSQKNAYYAQVEALQLTKKDNETVRHSALKVQQLVEKGWCNASAINLKCKEIFTKGLPKNLKDFANKRQVKHTSTVLEPSFPFHTLVKRVDAEDIANDKIRTHDLALENKLTILQIN